MGRLEKQKSQSGQAAVEYILLLVITVALILGLANQVYRPFGKWVENEMGPYLQCLLDVGELPSLGGEVSGECINPFSAGGANDPNSSKRNRNSASEDSASAQNKSASGSGSGSSGSSGSSRSSRGKGFTVGGQSGADGGGSAAGAGSEEGAEKLSKSSYFKFRSNNAESSQRGYSRTQLTAANPKGLKRRQTQEERVFSAGELGSEANGKKAKPLVVAPPERKPAAEDEEIQWNLGQYVKFAIILAIIIAIVLFVAGQVSSISKSMEK
jgi:hypothetical protein